MKGIKITVANGRYSIITTRDQEHRFGDKINRLSSTEAQPYIGANYDENGLVGGRTMTQHEVDALIGKAKASGAAVEGSL